MYSIFHPLDPNERLPRELILEGRRHRYLDKSLVLTIVGVLYLPALMLSIVVMSSFRVGMLVAFAVAGLGLAGVYLYVVSARD